MNEHDEELGGMPRVDVLELGLWRRTAGILVYDLVERRVLCHQRSPHKDERPGMWVATAGGKSSENEQPADTAVREFKEEIGLNVSKNEIQYWGKEKSDKRKQFEYLYYAEKNYKSANLFLDANEVEIVEWFLAETVIEKLKKDDNWFCYGQELDLICSIFS